MDQDSSRVIYKIIITIALIVSIIALIAILKNIYPRILITGDTFQYWAAGRIFISGDNPYDYSNVAALRVINGYEAEINDDAISLMLYPPWVFPLLIPFSFSSYPISKLLWLFFHIIIVFFASKSIWYLYKGSKKGEALVYFVSFSFTPTIYALGYGHISTIYLLGIVIFLPLIYKRSWIADLIAGFSIAFILLKPQLLVIFLIALILWITYNQKWWLLFGILLFIILNISIAILINHKIIAQYLEAMLNYPVGTWATPTLGTLLRLNFGINKLWLQIIPSIAGIIWIYFYWFRKRYSWNWLQETPIVLLASFLFSPYMWIYDMVILILPIIFIFSLFMTHGFSIYPSIMSGLYIIINVITFVLHRTKYDYWFFWFIPLLIIWFYFSEKSIPKILKIQSTQQNNSTIK